MTSLDGPPEQADRAGPECDDPLHGAFALPGRLIASHRVRLYLYRLVVAVVPLLVTIGFLTADVAGHVLSIAGAVLAVGSSSLAAVNTPRE
ncbi:MAG: hypothetical protein Q4E05_11030 [Pseudoclavibacter sp.]|nr:hypothetical protein [Pseudoclavibacter sp.]